MPLPWIRLHKNMKAVVLMLALFSVFIICSGQEILPQKSCKITACNERDILNRLSALEGKVQQQNKEIQQLRDNEKQLKNDVKILNESLIMLENEVRRTPQIPTVLQREPAMTPPSYTIPPTIRRTPQTPTLVHQEPAMTPPSYTIPPTNNTGKEFYVMFPSNKGLFHQLLISSEARGWAVIKIPYMGIEDNITVNQGSTYRNVSVAASLGIAEGIKKKGFYVISSVPITLYAMTVGVRLDPYVSPIYGSQTLGTKYISGFHRSNKLCILATRDLTTISFKFKIKSMEHVIYNGMLYKDGDILNLTMDNLSTFTLTTHESFAGTLIRSNYPIVVMDTNNNEFKQILPTRDWGKLFITPRLPLLDANGWFSYTPNYNNFTNISIFDISSTSYKSALISGPNRYSIDDLGLFIANGTIMLAIGWSKFAFIPPVSRYAYNYSCPLPYFYRPYSPAYENNVLILALSNNIEGIKVNDRVITNNDVQINATTLNGYNLIQIFYNVQTAHHVHVVSEKVKVAVFIVGHSTGPTKSDQYIYNCVS